MISTTSDIVIDTTPEGKRLVYLAKGYPGKKQRYEIDGVPVEAVTTFQNHDFMLLQTDKGDFLRDGDNQPVEGEGQWADYFFEPLTQSLYRQDERGSWYDLEGFRLASAIFLKGDVLISLPGKKSKQSWAFTSNELVISPHAKLVQIGKLVYNTKLEFVRYFGEKITGLGRRHISFGGTDQWQEIFLGIDTRAFINEFTGVPLLINDEEIVGHVAGVTRGARHFEVFRSATREYVLENSSSGDIRYDDQPLGIDLETYLTLNESEIVRANDGTRSYYFDLNLKEPYHIPETGKELITEISLEPVKLEGTTLYNVSTEHRSVVYDQDKRAPFILAGDEVMPEAVRNVPGFEEQFFYAILDGKPRLADKASRRIIELGDGKVQITQILGKPGGKLLNAKSIAGDLVVLDVRRGIRTLKLAFADGQVIHRIIGPSYRIGDMVLQHVAINSLGGLVSRVIDLEVEALTTFTLPEDLKEYPDQPQSSCFASNPMVNIDFLNPVTVQGQEFLKGTFLSDMGDERTTLLQHGNARPLHLDGAGHRNELVIGFKEKSSRAPYRLGEHLMVGAYTLNEELQDGELLFSVHKNKSWLPFYETFLPVFRRAVYIPELATWDCLLYEVLGPAGTGEYIAVEKNSPYRLLASKSKRKVEPRIITSKTRVLTDPDEMSALAKFFLDPGMLVEVS